MRCGLVLRLETLRSEEEVVRVCLSEAGCRALCETEGGGFSDGKVLDSCWVRVAVAMVGFCAQRVANSDSSCLLLRRCCWLSNAVTPTVFHTTFQ
jgi:hypothetical protein